MLSLSLSCFYCITFRHFSQYTFLFFCFLEHFNYLIFICRWLFSDFENFRLKCRILEAIMKVITAMKCYV